MCPPPLQLPGSWLEDGGRGQCGETCPRGAIAILIESQRPRVGVWGGRHSAGDSRVKAKKSFTPEREEPGPQGRSEVSCARKGQQRHQLSPLCPAVLWA